MNKDTLEQAVSTGLELLSDKSEIAVPMRLHDGVTALRGLLTGLATGRLALSIVKDEAPTPSTSRKKK